MSKVNETTLQTIRMLEAPGGKPGEPVDVLVVFEPGGEITIPRAFTFVDRSPLRAGDLKPQ